MWMHINFHWVYLSFPFHLLHLLFIVYFNCLTITLKSLHFFFAQVFSQFSSRHANFNFDIFSVECLPWVFSWIMVMKWHLLNKHLDKFTFNLDGVLFVCFCSMIMCCFFYSSNFLHLALTMQILQIVSCSSTKCNRVKIDFPLLHIMTFSLRAFFLFTLYCNLIFGW